MGFLDSVKSGYNLIMGGKPPTEGKLEKYSTAGFDSPYNQDLLPYALRGMGNQERIFSGVKQIGQMIQNPGQLSPTVSSAINPRLAIESENIAQNFRGLGQNQAGAAARSNLPVSIRTALQSALGVAQERAQRDTRRGALSDSDQLKRQDLEQVYKLLDQMRAFSLGGKGIATQGLTAGAQLEQQRIQDSRKMIEKFLSMGASA